MTRVLNIENILVKIRNVAFEVRTSSKDKSNLHRLFYTYDQSSVTSCQRPVFLNIVKEVNKLCWSFPRLSLHLEYDY